MGLVVIGAGLPRTGTMSLKTALEHLLDGPCYHMISFIMEGNEREANHWRQALEAERKQKPLDAQTWRDFLKAHRAAVDYPISFFYEELLEVFPEAKVVLTVRNPTSWHDSVKAGIMRTQEIIRKFPASWLVAIRGGTNRLDVAHEFSWAQPKGFEGRSMFSVINGGYDESTAFFNQWSERVKAVVPPERLLIFQVKEGWKPLCDFLGLPEPTIPFPRVNDSASMKKRIDNLQISAWILAFFIPTVIAYLFYYFLFQ